MKNIFYILFGMVFLFACNKAPEACIVIGDGTERPAKVNKPVKFTSCSINAKKYEWDFGDGNKQSNSGPTVSYAYSEPGAYNVTLTVKNGLKEESASKPVTVVE